MSHRSGGSRPVRYQDHSGTTTDCTQDCACSQHAAVVLTSVALGNLRLLQHCSSLCSNPWRITDHLGRNPLHIAASRGHTHITDWLITQKKVAVDMVDGESGWSALHRSVYYGELGTTINLVKHGASLSVKDNDGLTPLSLLNKERLQLREVPDVTSIDVYTWGSNANTTLGHAHSRPHPERLELPNQHTITQVVLEKFHSVMLTSCGAVLTCGHGRGGRLGHGNEASLVVPRVIEALTHERCISIAAARNHTVFLTQSGVVYSCGLNDAHQLGLGSAPNSAPKQCLSPTPITAKILRGRHIRGIGVGRYHTALATDSHVYTYGQNLGQLGYEKNHPTQIIPKAVPQISIDEDDCIISLSASHAATAVLTKKHRIYVCCDFIVKSLRCGFLEKLSCRLFKVCASLTDRAHIRGTTPEPTKIILLDSEQKLWYWEPGKKGTVPYLLPDLANYNVSHVTLGKYLTIVTDEGEVYMSIAISGQSLSFSRLHSIQNASAFFSDYKATNFAYLQYVNSVLDLPTVTPPTLTTDLCSLLKEEHNMLDSVADIELEAGEQIVSAHRYIVSHLTSHPLTSPTHTLPPSPPHIINALIHYLYGAEIRLIPIPDKSDTDTISKSALPTSSSLHVELTPDTSFTSVDENDLTEMYDQFGNQATTTTLQRDNRDENRFEEIEINLTDRFDWLQSTPKKTKNKRKAWQSRDEEDGHVKTGRGGRGCDGDNCVSGEVLEVRCVNVRKDLQNLLRLATDLQVTSLLKKLDGVLSNFSQKQASRSVVLVPPPLSLSSSHLPNLTDITIHTSDHQTLNCHKCVLVARSDYFKSMLLMGWRETSDGSTSLSLPFTHQLLNTVIDYMYTDSAPSVTKSDSLEWIVQVLVVADQLLLTRLRDICELTLAKKLTLRSVCDVLDIAATCSATQLRVACLQFIGTNTSALLEGRLLESLSPALLTELSTVYKEMVPSMSKRVIKFPDPDPSELPESYFLEGDDGGEREEGRDETRYITPDRLDNNMRSPPPLASAPESPTYTTVHSSSGSRRRRRDGRRRKSSQSESHRRSQSCRGSMSPSPTPTSPPVISPPLTPSPLSPPSPHHSLTPNNIKDDNTTTRVGINKNTTSTRVQTGSKPVSQTGSSTPIETPVESRVLGHSGSDEVNSLGLRDSTGNYHKGPRKRLTDSYGSSERGRRGGEEGVRMERGQSQDVPNGPRAVWGVGVSCDRGQGGKAVSLKDIIAEEEKKMDKKLPHPHKGNHPHTSPSPPHITGCPPSSPSSSHSLPASRQTSSDYGTAPPLSSSLPRSPPTNPWGTAQMSTSPVVSLKDLMAAEERQKALKGMTRKTVTGAGVKHSQLKHTSSSPHPQTSSPPAGPDDSNVSSSRRRPSIPQAPPPVSFADIILSQQREQDIRRCQAGKPLSSIQIEQKAINQLEILYSSHGNPDEYITVRRYRPSSHTPALRNLKSHTHPTTPPSTSPWNMR